MSYKKENQSVRYNVKYNGNVEDNDNNGFFIVSRVGENDAYNQETRILIISITLIKLNIIIIIL